MGNCNPLGMDKQCHLTLFNGCNYLSMLGFKLILVSKSGPITKWLTSCKEHDDMHFLERNCWHLESVFTGDHSWWYTKPISQIPQCTCHLSHNAPFRRKMCTFLFWMVHCGIWMGAMQDLWILSIDNRSVCWLREWLSTQWATSHSLNHWPCSESNDNDSTCY